MANHASPRTTLYDRRRDEVSLDEIRLYEIFIQFNLSKVVDATVMARKTAMYVG